MSHRVTRRTSLLALIATAIQPQLALAADPAAARKVVETMITSALAILRDPALKADRKGRQARLRNLANGSFDWEGMARGSLGHYWRDLKPEERSAFVDVFKTLLAKQYMDDIDRFQGNEEVKVIGATAKGDLVAVKTMLITASREKIPMDYTLHQAGSKWLVEDLAIEGVSMVAHYRKSFKRFLVNKSFAELLKVLKRKLG